METNGEQSPRDLASDYANGLISFDDYRSRRRQLIDRQMCERVRQDTMTATDTDSSDRPDVLQGATREQKAHTGIAGRFVTVVLVAGALVLAVIATRWLLYGGSAGY